MITVLLHDFFLAPRSPASRTGRLGEGEFFVCFDDKATAQLSSMGTAQSEKNREDGAERLIYRCLFSIEKIQHQSTKNHREIFSLALGVPPVPLFRFQPKRPLQT